MGYMFGDTIFAHRLYSLDKISIYKYSQILIFCLPFL